MKPMFLAGFSLLLAPSIAGQGTLLDLSGSPSERFAHVCDLVADMNGDGIGEVIVAAPNAANGGLFMAGRLTVHSGANGVVLATVSGATNADGLGWATSSVGDVNGDGRTDFCASSLGTGDPGTAFVFSGANGSVLHTFTGPASDLYGWAVAGIGDVNGDGRDDVLVSAPSARNGGGFVAGALTVYSGADGSILRQVFGDSPGVGLGTSAGRVGDVNGDGIADFAGIQTNIVRLFSGADGSELGRHGCGPSEGRVAGGFDANHDGFDDFVIGARMVNSEAGRLQLISGRDFSILFETSGVGGDWLGASVSGAGDLDADGAGDFVAGMPGFDGAAGTDTGAVRAYSGRTGGVIGTVEGDVAGDQLGWSVAGGRDVDGDGVPDVVAGSVVSGKAKAITFVPRGLGPFGTGTAGCTGASALLANGIPARGNSSFALQASNTGGSPLLLIGDSEDTLGSFLFGARFHLNFNPPPPAVGLVFQAPLPQPDANGTLVAPFPIPNTPALAGLTFIFQVASLFSSGSCAQRLTTSRGLRVTIQ